MSDFNIHWLKSTDSTNDDASRNSDISNDKTVWIAQYQTAGRGQRGNHWESESGQNLTFSILLKPTNMLSIGQFVISQIASVGIIEYLNKRGVSAKIKWPNDIYVGNKKICGMLIQNVVENNLVKSSIIGIGFNLNQTLFLSDAPNPTSLKIETCSESLYDLEYELISLLTEIYSLYDNVDGYKALSEKYVSLLYRLDKECSFMEMPSEKEIQGTIVGIDENARLKLMLQNGQIKTYAFKEIKYL